MKFRFTINVPKWLDRLCAWPVVMYRKFKYGYPYRKITLNDGQFTIVDPDVYYRLNDFDWCAKGSNGHTYVVRFVTTPKNGTKTIYLHREITNAPFGKIVDHKNNDSLDNRIDNLRLATRSQNGCNSHIDKSKTSSRYRGVHFRKKSGKWAAAIRNKSEKVWLGSFQNELDAAHAYDLAARKYHKVFARVNFPEEAPLS
jgi:hypothetical protein